LLLLLLRLLLLLCSAGVYRVLVDEFGVCEFRSSGSRS
jgi:hypothetical protein